MPQTVLVVDDEPDVLTLVRKNLEREDFIVLTAADGEQAMEKARASRPDVIILDIMLPMLNGYEVCRQLRADAGTSHIPLLMLSAKGNQLERIAGFELGADDYVSKPFSPRELVYRVKALARRLPVALTSDGVKGFKVDTKNMKVSIDGRPLNLTPTEFKLFRSLIDRRDEILTREFLLSDVLHYESSASTRTIDTHMRRIREKLGRSSGCIETVRSYGYRFST